MSVSPREVLKFWFEEIDAKQRFTKDPEFDRLVTERFGDVLKAAAQCELFTWRHSPESRLAEIIVLDQFSRNIYRDQPAAFMQDPLALSLAQEMVMSGQDRQLPSAELRGFAYLPYMHSESLVIHHKALRLFKELKIEEMYTFEVKHKKIIEKFARYPHRNALLGRESTPEEVDFLEQPDSSF